MADPNEWPPAEWLDGADAYAVPRAPWDPDPSELAYQGDQATSALDSGMSARPDLLEAPQDAVQAGPYDHLFSPVPAPTPEAPPSEVPPLSAGGPVQQAGLQPGDRVSYARSFNRSPIPVEPDPISGAAYPSAEGYAANIASGMTTQERALEIQADATAGLNQVEAANAAQHARLLDDQRLDRMAAEHKGRKDRDAAWAAIQEINPSRVWNDSSAGFKAVNILGAALGGWLAVRGRNGGRNPMMETINQVVENDIKAQQVNQDLAKSKAYRVDRQVDKRLEDINLQYAMRYDALGKQLIAESSQYKSMFTQAKIMEQVGELQTKAGEYMNKYFVDAAAFHQHDLDQQREMQNAAANRAVTIRGQNKEMERAYLSAGVDPKTGQPLLGGADTGAILFSPVDGKAYRIDPRRMGADPKHPQITPEYMKDVDKNWQANAKIGMFTRELFDSTTALGTTYGGLLSTRGPLTDQQKEAVRGMYGKLAAIIVKKESGAAFTKEEMEVVRQYIGDVETWTRVGPQTQLRQLMKHTGKEQNAIARSLHLTDAETGEEYDWEKEFYIPQLDPPKAGGVKGALKTLQGYKEIPGVTGEDTREGVKADAKSFVEHMDRATPTQLVEAYTDLVNAAATADPATARKLVTRGKQIEARLRALDAINKARGHQQYNPYDRTGSEADNVFGGLFGSDTGGYLDDPQNVRSALDSIDPGRK